MAKLPSLLRMKRTPSMEKHLNAVKKAVEKKHGLLEGKVLEFKLQEFPRSEFAQLSKILKEYDRELNADMLSVLLGLEVNIHQLESSMGEELFFVNNIEKEKSVSKGIYKDVALGEELEHQINILVDVLHLSNNALNLLYSVKDRQKQDILRRILLNINRTANFSLQISFNEELKELSIAYNALKLKEWPGIEKRILDIKDRLLALESHML